MDTRQTQGCSRRPLPPRTHHPSHSHLTPPCSSGTWGSFFRDSDQPSFLGLNGAACRVGRGWRETPSMGRGPRTSRRPSPVCPCPSAVHEARGPQPRTKPVARRPPDTGRDEPPTSLPGRLGVGWVFSHSTLKSCGTRTDKRLRASTVSSRKICLSRRALCKATTASGPNPYHAPGLAQSLPSGPCGCRSPSASWGAGLAPSSDGGVDRAAAVPSSGQVAARRPLEILSQISAK